MARPRGRAVSPDVARVLAWLLFGAGLLAGCVGEIGESEGGGGPGGAGGTGTPPPQGNLPVTDLPCDVETVLSTRCWSCHGPTPMLGLPALTSTAAFMAASLTVPSQSIGTVAVARMQSTTSPMPPAPNAPATASEIATLSNWVGAGYSAGGGCGAPVCTSGMTYAGGEGSPNMDPGQACISCHARSGGEAPTFSIAGTVYPTLHEPDLCYGASSSSGAQIVITGADGRSLTLSPNAAGNFYSQMAIALPFSAKVVTSAGERAMVATQTSGYCNSCHTQPGANAAPGRILLP